MEAGFQPTQAAAPAGQAQDLIATVAAISHSLMNEVSYHWKE
jgi:hypothetical protein